MNKRIMLQAQNGKKVELNKKNQRNKKERNKLIKN